MTYMEFVHNIFKNRLFLLSSSIDPLIQLYCRSGHEMENLALSNYEDKVRSIFVPRSSDVVVDVGAHIGEYTVPIARKALKVIAIEPNPGVSAILQKNIDINGLSNVLIVNKAVYDSRGHQRMNIFGDRSGMSSMVLEYENKSETIEVATDTLDNILYDLHIDRVEWLKIDVEGAEVCVLKGAKRTIASNLEHIKFIIESHGDENATIIKTMLANEFKLNLEMLDTNHIFAYTKGAI